MVDVGVIGLGLIGGSIALNLAQGFNVGGYDIDPLATELALKKDAISIPLDSLEGFKDARLIFVATPPLEVVSTVDKLSKVIRNDAVITDCAGVKSIVLRDIEESVPDAIPMFVGGHPMAGRERGGFEYALPTLFENATWVLTPTERTSPRALELVAGTVQTFGAHPLFMSTIEHDLAVAAVSHLPHFLAGILVQMAQKDSSFRVGGGSWADLTRIAGVNPSLWTEVSICNREAIANRIDQFMIELEKISDALRLGDEKLIRRFFDHSLEAKKAERID